jgi:hypothetical protein
LGGAIAILRRTLAPGSRELPSLARGTVDARRGLEEDRHMRTRDLMLATAITASLALAACGGTNDTGASTSLSNHDTESVANVELDDLIIDGALTEALSQMDVVRREVTRSATLAPVAPAVPRPIAEPLPPPVGALLEAWQIDSPVFGQCVQKTGDLIDVDRDGIPKYGSYVFDCQDFVANGRHVTVTGVVTVEDTDDTSPRSGFQLVWNGFSASATPVAATSRLGAWSRKLNGSLETDPGPAGEWILTKDYDLTRSSDSRSATVTGQTISTYVPSDANHPFAAGDVKIDALDSVDLPDGSTTTLRQVTQPSLHTNAVCRAESQLGFDSGSLSVEREDQPVLAVSFDGCGHYQATSGGEPVLLEE